MLVLVLHAAVGLPAGWDVVPGSTQKISLICHPSDSLSDGCWVRIRGAPAVTSKSQQSVSDLGFISSNDLVTEARTAARCSERVREVSPF